MMGLGIAFLVLLALAGTAKAAPGGAGPTPPGPIPPGPTPAPPPPPGPPAPPGNLPSPPAPPATQSTYVVQATDKKGPWGLAQLWMGDGNTGYRQLKAVNPQYAAKWDAGSSWFAGMTINIPPTWPPKPATISGGMPAIFGSSMPEIFGASMPVLHSGVRGPAVREWQRFLGVNADGIFGFKTAMATRDFQRHHGLVPDGVVGPRTWALAHRISSMRMRKG